MKLSDNFTLSELTHSSTADRLEIDNSLTLEGDRYVVDNLKCLADKILQPVRDHFGVPFLVSSGYRSYELEEVLTAKSIARFIARNPGKTKLDYLKTKSHPTGQAADFEVPGMSNLALAHWIEKNLKFDQLILEFYSNTDPRAGWVHASYKSPGENRQQTLTIKKSGTTLGLPL